MCACLLRFSDLDSVAATLKKELQHEVLFYTFVNHAATFSDILNDVAAATQTPNKDTVRSSLNSLIARGYVSKSSPQKGSPVYMNNLFVEDISGLGSYRSVSYYLTKIGKGIESEHVSTLGGTEELHAHVMSARKSIAALHSFYYGNDDKISETLGQMLQFLRYMVGPDIKKRSK